MWIEKLAEKREGRYTKTSSTKGQEKEEGENRVQDVNGGQRTNRLLRSRREQWRERYVGGKTRRT